MKQDLFPTRSSIFTGAAVEKQILSHYQLSPPVTCHFFRQGINDTYQVISGDATHYLRVYQVNWRSEEEVQAEIDFLNHLKQACLPLSFPVQRKDGTFMQPIEAAEGRRYAVLFTSAPGTLHKNPTASQSHQLGRLTAQIHGAAAGHNSRHGRNDLDLTYLVDSPLVSIRSVFSHRADDMRFLDRLAERIKGRLGSIPAEQSDHGLCHGDLHTENVHFDQEGRPTLFDCDCFGYGWRAYDLATFLWSRYLFETTVASREQNWDAFLNGYQRERPLPAASQALIPTLVAARQFWVMGIHTGQATEHYGRRWLNEKYIRKHFGFIRKISVEFGLTD